MSTAALTAVTVEVVAAFVDERDGGNLAGVSRIFVGTSVALLQVAIAPIRPLPETKS